MSTQQFEEITLDSLMEKVQAMKGNGCRLAQIGATTTPEGLEIVYSFARGVAIQNMRLRLPLAGARMPSISSIYWCAFLYENEIHDLFNVEVTDMAVDFKGNFYNTSVKYAFNSPKAPCAVPSPANPTLSNSTSKAE
jgi:ech hydrogenase subunit D